MEKQAKLLKKREQRHKRESNERLDKVITDFVRHKYPSIYAEARQYHDELDAIYPDKRNIIKTVEHTAWLKKVKEQMASNNKRMDLKIQLMHCKKKDSVVVVNKSSPSTVLHQPADEISSTGLHQPADEISSTGLHQPADEIPSTGLHQPADEIPSTVLHQPADEISSTELDQIIPSLSAEISPQMIQSIMDELKGDKDLNMFLEDIEMNDYVLEEEEQELY